MRVVLDTNVLVSAAIQRGPSYEIVKTLLQDQRIQLIICEEIIEELREVLLTRPRLRKWITVEEANNYIQLLEMTFDILRNPTVIPTLSRDSDDDYVLALAAHHNAVHIVSGDKDLLVLAMGTRSVLSPSEFWQLVKPML